MTKSVADKKIKQYFRLNILTFDIEDWYMSYENSQIAHSQWPRLESRIESNLNDILAFLESHNTHATFYIMGWIAARHPETVKMIALAGHEIGYHSFYHELPVKQGFQQFKNDLDKGLGLLEKSAKKKSTLLPGSTVFVESSHRMDYPYPVTPWNRGFQLHPVGQDGQ